MGGALNYIKDVPFKDDMKRYTDWIIRTVKNKNIKIHINTEVTPELVEEIKPDFLIIAVGAEPIVPEIEGVHGKNVILATEVTEKIADIGNKVVIVGGGLVGCEEAVNLAKHNGRDVTILEMQPDVAIDSAHLHRSALVGQLDEYVKYFTNVKCTKIGENGVTAVDKDGSEKFYEADTVVIAAGMKSLNRVVESLRGCIPEYRIIGDCLKPRKILEAVYGGYDAAMDV